MKEMTDNLPREISESRNLRNVLIRVKDFLKKTSESEICSSPKLEIKAKIASDIPPSNNDSSKLQAEENVDATEAKPSEDELEKSKRSNLEPKQQNVDHDEERNKSKLNSIQQNKPTSDTSTSNMHEHELDERVHAIEVNHCEDRGNSLRESDEPTKSEIEHQNAPRSISSASDVSEMSDDNRVEENVKVAGVDESQEQEHVFQNCIGSYASTIGKTMPSENSNKGSRSSRHGKQGEVQVIEKFDRGVYVILMLQSDGTKKFKRVKFR